MNKLLKYREIYSVILKSTNEFQTPFEYPLLLEALVTQTSPLLDSSPVRFLSPPQSQNGGLGLQPDSFVLPRHLLLSPHCAGDGSHWSGRLW